jgi:hypothetical protein
LEASFIRAELSRVSVIQWGTPFSGKFRSTEIERDLGDSGTWVVLTIARSIFGIFFRVIWTLFIRAELSRVSVIQWGTPFSGNFRSTEIERDLGDSGHLGYSYHHPIYQLAYLLG